MIADQQYISKARKLATELLDAITGLKEMQTVWNALDYGNTLPDGTNEQNVGTYGNNIGYTKTEVGAAVFATADAFEALLASGHATNLAKLR